ncbi:MAG TPA: BMC domain-containing protein [Blastocatellia bacterium]|jgi:microcompartment protein CcmL/EutN|nr:BMC domain-containing protein [Blastocatellia bacterium]
MSDLISSRSPCIGFIESSSIARGIEATDAMMKMAEVDLLMTTIIPRGKYLIMIGGRVADVESSLRAGLEVAGDTVLDHFIIQNVHPELPAAIKGRVKVERIEAVGIIETKEVASAIYAGDAAVKSANIKLIEARNQPGGKGLVVLCGEVGAVRTAVAAGVASIKREGMLVAQVVIPYAHEALLKSLTS